MATIKLKNSQVKGKVPGAGDLDVGGELAVNHHADDPGIFLKDTAGNVRKIAGSGAIGSNWTRTGTTLAPATAGDVVTVSAGTAALPGLAVVGDPNTGLYSPSADQVALATAGTERMRITQAGDLNYGTGGGIVDPGTGTTDGFYYNNTDKQFVLSRNGGASLILRRHTSDGAIQGFYHDTKLIGTFNVSTTDLTIANSTSGSIVFNRAALIESARIDPGGMLLVGTSASITAVTFPARVQSNAYHAYSASLFSADSYSSNFLFIKSRNPVTGSHTVVQQSDVLGQLQFTGSDGTAFIPGAVIAAAVDGTPGANDMPGRLMFSTTAKGAARPAERMRISSDGSVTVYSLAGTGAGTVGVDATGKLNRVDGALSSRNVIINGMVNINQRGVTIAAAAVGAYGPDRWKKVDAGNMTQIIEDLNVVHGAKYTLSWKGGTPQVLTAPATGHWTLPNIPITATEIQLELGEVATPFERRSYGQELVLCQRYFEIRDGGHHRVFVVTAAHPALFAVPIFFLVTKRVAPSIALVGTITSLNSRDELVLDATTTSLRWQFVSHAGNLETYILNRSFALSAEL